MDTQQPSNYSRLYDEAGQKAPGTTDYPTEDICPLYHSLKRTDIRYSKGEILSTGGMKEILRVYDEPTERYVALARPKAEVPIEKYDAFLREAHITGRLEHPNIIKLFDMGIDAEKRPFFTMEFKRGHSLRKILQKLKKGKASEEWPREQRYSIFLRVCEAMAYAHSRHVLHLDLKPENIQVGTFGEVQICDWGLGEIARGTSETHLTEALLDPDLYGDQLPTPAIGTPGYMAPEQEDPKSVKTVKSDLFALGCLLYELTTLLEPTERQNNPPESTAIAAIVKKACAPKPKDRYRDVESMRKDVYRHVLGFSPAVEQTGFLRECRLFYGRNKVPSQITIAFTILILGVGSWFHAELTQSYHNTAQALDKTNIALKQAEDAKAQANIEQSKAEKARDEAEQLLGKYLQEKENSSALLISQSQNTVRGSLLLLDFLIMDESITESAIENSLSRIEFALANNPPPSDRLWTLKAHALFIMQRFEEAKKFYQIRRGTQGDLMAMTAEYAPLINESGLLPTDDFIRLIRSLIDRKEDRAPLMEKMVIYDSLRRESVAERAKIIKAAIELANLESEQRVDFDYSESSQHLKISGSKLKKLIRPKVPDEGSPYPSRSMLRFLNIRSLDISNTQVGDLSHLGGLQLHNLDIRNTAIEDLSPLTQMASLRELTVKPDQFTQAQLDEVANYVLIIKKATDSETKPLLPSL